MKKNHNQGCNVNLYPVSELQAHCFKTVQCAWSLKQEDLCDSKGQRSDSCLLVAATVMVIIIIAATLNNGNCTREQGDIQNWKKRLVQSFQIRCRAPGARAAAAVAVVVQRNSPAVHWGVKCDYGGLPAHIRTWQMKRQAQRAEPRCTSAATATLWTLEGTNSACGHRPSGLCEKHFADSLR